MTEQITQQSKNLAPKLNRCISNVFIPVFAIVLLTAPNIIVNAQYEFSAANNIGFPMGATTIGASTQPAAVSGTETVGNENFNFEVPIVNLPGRALNASLSLAYNSRVWDRKVIILPSVPGGNNSHISVGYNWDTANWLAPGFYLGYGSLDMQTLTSPDGTKHPFEVPTTEQTPTIGPDYLWTNDGSFIKFVFNSPGYCHPGVAYFPDGSVIDYGASPVNPCQLYPTKIKDRNGNFILINYVNGIGPKISNIQDTMGRLVKFYYDSTGSLVTITTPGFNGSGERQLIRFYYEDISITPSFQTNDPGYPSLPVNIYAQATAKVVKHIYFPGTQKGYTYDYSSYGMVYQINEKRGLTITSNSLNQTGDAPTGGIVSLLLQVIYRPVPQPFQKEQMIGLAEQPRMSLHLFIILKHFMKT
jgi:hypothetical protein